MSLPANQATAYWVDCAIWFSQTTAAVSDTFGVNFTTAPSASQWEGLMVTANTPTFVATTPVAVSGSGTTTLFTFTPGASATVYFARIWGSIENPSSGQDNILTPTTSQATAADTMVIKRDSACMLHSMN